MKMVMMKMQTVVLSTIPEYQKTMVAILMDVEFRQEV